MELKIVVMSCDNNQDLWLPFYHCMEKYWSGHPEIIYSTESVVNPYYKTICRKLPINQWTKRVYETIEQIKCSHVLLMVDDIFLRDYVNGEFITLLCKYVQSPIASLNFEFSFDKMDKPYNEKIMVRNPFGKFKLSCMTQLWTKHAILDLFNTNKDPWTFEKENKAKGYIYLISKNGDFLNWGKPKVGWEWGIVKGKWTQECKDFFDKEGIEIDYSIRGFWKGK